MLGINRAVTLGRIPCMDMMSGRKNARNVHSNTRQLHSDNHGGNGILVEGVAAGAYIYECTTMCNRLRGAWSRFCV